jgi:Flp pilus assembly protein TadG
MKSNQVTNKNERGQSLVEMAISLIIILFLLVGAVEFSIALYQYVAMRDAAQEGALYGSIHPDEEAQIKQRVVAAASDVLTLSPDNTNVQIEILPTSAPRCEGLTYDPDTASMVPNTIKVTVTFSHTIFMPLVPAMIGTNTINLTAEVTDTILYQCPS